MKISLPPGIRRWPNFLYWLVNHGSSRKKHRFGEVVKPPSTEPPQEVQGLMAINDQKMPIGLLHVLKKPFTTNKQNKKKSGNPVEISTSSPTGSDHINFTCQNKRKNTYAYAENVRLSGSFSKTPSDASWCDVVAWPAPDHWNTLRCCSWPEAKDPTAQWSVGCNHQRVFVVSKSLPSYGAKVRCQRSKSRGWSSPWWLKRHHPGIFSGFFGEILVEHW